MPHLPDATAKYALIRPADATRVAKRVRDRIVPELPLAEARETAEVLRVFAGLRPGGKFLETVMTTTADLFQASKSYRETVLKGRVEGERATVVRMGTARFGPPPAAVSDRVAAATTDELDRLADRLLSAAGWDDLLAGT